MSQDSALWGIGQTAHETEDGMSNHRSRETPAWNEARISQLKVLWEQGLSASSIGHVLSMTKNAVVGKARRLKLSARPSPIGKRRKPLVQQAAALARPILPAVDLSTESPVAAASAKPPVAPETKLETESDKTEPDKTEPDKTEPDKTEPDTGTAASLAPMARRGRQSLTTAEAMQQLGLLARRQSKDPGRVGRCSWPVGDPGDKDFHFCGADTLPGKSYCAEHCRKAYLTKSRADS